MLRSCLALLTALTLAVMPGCSAGPEPTPHAAQTGIQTGEPALTEPDPEPVPEPVPEPEDIRIRMNIVGDVMLAAYKDQTKAGNFNDYANQKEPEYFLEKVRPIFQEDDFTLVNLENVFTDSPLKEVKKNSSPAYWYKSRTANVGILTCSSVEAVSLANNHTGDYGAQGRADTIAAVEAAGLEYGTNERTFYLEKDGFRIAVICNGLWNQWQTDAIVKRLAEAEQDSDFQIVFYHGGKERVHAPEQWRIEASRELVDAGADLVVGNHPHVLQPLEVYNGVDIVYSMGNFCFGGDLTPENRTVIYQMNLKIDPETREVTGKESTLIPCVLYDGSRNTFQPHVIEDEAMARQVLDFMDGRADSPL